MVGYHGRWLVTVVAKDSAWEQRVVIAGATVGAGTLAGTVGSGRTVDGDNWSLTVEHNDGQHGWQPNAVVAADPLVEAGAALAQLVRTKDVIRPGDTDPNDLVVRVEKLGPMFEVSARPYAVDAGTLNMLPDGVFVGINGLQMMGVEIRNTWGRAFHPDSTLAVSALGRATLQSFGVLLRDAWPPQMLAAVQQTQAALAMRLPALDVGERHTVFFLVDASTAQRGKPNVELVLRRSSGDPDPSNGMRFNRRQVFIAEVGFDAAQGSAVAVVPEGRLTLQLRSIAVSTAELQRLCRELVAPGRGSGGGRLIDDVRRLLAENRGHGRDPCDPKLLRELLALLCRCLAGGAYGCGCDSGGDKDPACDGTGIRGWCSSGGVWLPLRFEYSVEINGGFAGQYGPLAFQDPWWKVLLAVLAFLAWLVGLIAEIAGDAGYGVFATDKPKKIGVVGASSLANVDAAIVELDGSRPFEQASADALTGETNSTPILGLDTIIPIDPQAATAFMGMRVFKSGARTGLTHGIVTAVGAGTSICRGEFENGVCTPDPQRPDQLYSGQILVALDPAFAEEQFSDHGDSGSIVLSAEPASMNQVVGLLYGGSDTVTDVSPIGDVLNALQLKLRP